MKQRTSAPVPASAAILGLAQQRATSMLQEAREQVDLIHREARDAGYRDGYSEGYARAEEVVKARYQEALEEVQRSRLMQEAEIASWFAQAAPHFTAMVVDAVSRLVKRRCEEEHEVAAKVVGEALDALGQAAWSRVRVNPADLPAVQQALAVRAAGRVLEEITVVPDETLLPGGVVVEAPGARVDASLEARLELFAESVQQA